MSKKKRLGRGLEALLSVGPDGEMPSGGAEQTATPASGDGSGELVHLDVFEIQDNPFQPRREFNDSEIDSLAESLQEHELLQPILVRVVDGRYQLISGERRLRAAIKANWKTIPAQIREADDRLVAELAIVENLQRKDLNAVEKALSFRRYIDQHQCTQEELARRLKVDRSTIANLIRLLELPEAVQDSLRSGAITAGHARALLPLGEESLQIEYCQRVQQEGMSVRAIEAAVAELIDRQDSPVPKQTSRNRRSSNPQVKALEQELKMALGTRVRIKSTARGKGTIVIDFADHDEFERLRQVLHGGVRPARAA